MCHSIDVLRSEFSSSNLRLTMVSTIEKELNRRSSSSGEEFQEEDDYGKGEPRMGSFINDVKFIGPREGRGICDDNIESLTLKKSGGKRC